jgi:N-acetylneuraminate synthase
MAELKIGKHTVGPGHPVYFIAEAGSNHDRDLDQARRLIDVAADAGADAVKFQTFRADALYPRSAGMTDYLAVPRSIFDIIRDLEMPLEWLPILARHATERGLDFLSTPFDEASADALDPYCSAIKIASYEMTHHPLVQHCARKGKPLIVSTGTAHLDEVREVAAAIRAVSDVPFALLQCTARYPAPLDALNLRTLATMARELGVPVGLSDHSREPLPGPMAATALGASLIEKHFTLDNQLPGPDHAYALEPHELTQVIAAVRQVERTLGTGEKRPHPVEEELRSFARRTIFTRRTILNGERFSIENVSILRRGKLPDGLHPRELLRVVGRAARRELPAETAIRADDLGELVLRDGAVTLRPLAAEDTERVLAWRTEAQPQLFSATPPTRAEHEAWLASLELRADRVEFVIVDGGRAVGTIGLSHIDLGHHTAEYGVLVSSEARGRGVARAASRALLQFAFEALALDEVRLSLFADNAPARRLYDALGFSVVEPPPAPRLKDGATRAVTAMRLRRDAWKAAR